MKEKRKHARNPPPYAAPSHGGVGPSEETYVQLSQESKEGDSRQYRPKPLPCGNKVYRWPMEKKVIPGTCTGTGNLERQLPHLGSHSNKKQQIQPEGTQASPWPACTVYKIIRRARS